MTPISDAADRYERTEVNRFRVYYRMVGSGEPVVLLHGFPETSLAWRKVMPALAERYTVSRPIYEGAVRPTGRKPDTINARLRPKSARWWANSDWVQSTYSAMTPE